MFNHGADPAPSAEKRSTLGYVWGMLAILTCPCTLPLLTLLLSGTVAGALLSEHQGIASLTLTALFVLFVAAALRAFWDRS